MIAVRARRVVEAGLSSSGFLVSSGRRRRLENPLPPSGFGVVRATGRGRGGSRRESTSGHRHERVSSVSFAQQAPLRSTLLHSAPVGLLRDTTRQSAGSAAPASLHTLSRRTRCTRRTRSTRIPRPSLPQDGPCLPWDQLFARPHLFSPWLAKGRQKAQAKLRMREIVHLQAGQCGNQIGAKVGRPSSAPKQQIYACASISPCFLLGNMFLGPLQVDRKTFAIREPFLHHLVSSQTCNVHSTMNFRRANLLSRVAGCRNRIKDKAVADNQMEFKGPRTERDASRSLEWIVRGKRILATFNVEQRTVLSYFKFFHRFSARTSESCARCRFTHDLLAST